jgi:putative Mg2+ transporter-C (MgtC) family protein
VSGITTAASIWIAAAIGMLIGLGEFGLAGISLGMALFILYILDFFQLWIDDRFQHRDYRIVFKDTDKSSALRHKIEDLKLNVDGTKVTRQEGEIIFEISVSGKESRIVKFNHWLLEQPFVISFEW